MVERVVVHVLLFVVSDSLPAQVPQVLINREPLKHMTFDVELLGNCDIIVNELCRRLGDGWNQICTNDVTETSNEITRDEMVTPVPPSGDDSPYHAPPGGGGGGGGEAVTKTQDDKVASSSTNGSQSTQSPEVTSSSATGSSSTAESHDSSCNSSSSNVNTHNSENDTEITDSNAQTEAKNENVALESDLETTSAAKGSGSGNENSNSTLQSSVQNDAESKPSASKVDGKGYGASSDGEEAEVRDAHERDDAELSMLRASWQPKLINLASRLPGEYTD